MQFLNRRDAGEQLAGRLKGLAPKDSVVLALPRGGVVLGVEIAKSLRVPLGLILVRKIGHPFHSEYAIGALAEDQEPIYNEAEISHIDRDWLKNAEEAARQIIAKRRQLYYGKNFTPPQIRGKRVIVVDDGVATGLTMRAAVNFVETQAPSVIIIAVPVAPRDSLNDLNKMVDQVVLLDSPDDFLGAVGAHYQEFEQVTDHEVRGLLREAHEGLMANITGDAS